MSTTTTQTTTTTTTSTPTSSTLPLSSTPSSNPIQATLNFFSPPPDGSRPYIHVEEPPAGVPRTNFEVTAHTVPIADMRGRESEFSLDKHAFLPVTAANNPTSSSSSSSSSAADFSSDAAIERTYYPEVEQLLLSVLPGTPKRVVIFDHTVRRTGPGAHRSPVMRVHIDQTAASARARVLRHTGSAAEAAALLRGRHRLVNVWRPLNGPVEASPLAVADSASVRDDRLVPVRHVYPDREGETAAVRFDPAMRWWFWAGMRDDERLLLQCFDSERGARVPHSAFLLDGQEGRKQRESIEVRALVFG
ncbi:MAG: hypothetical protein LQ340_007341 [Diploschistes diacapsis]|nr:MAG: hypothetical protein LQ340_007341 [Diploschistes diacapsis]